MIKSAVTTQSSARNLQVIDLLDPKNRSRKPYISDSLIEAIAERLSRREQTLLFLNRRGTARVVMECNRCGWQAICPNCDIVHLHIMVMYMQCVVIAATIKHAYLNQCPECENPEIILKSIGTKAIASEIESLFPEARIMRFDTDNKKMERIEQHYKDIRSGKSRHPGRYSRETLAKGLDPTQFGTCRSYHSHDTSLYFPDFSAQERTYELLHQVVGRVGRQSSRE